MVLTDRVPEKTALAELQTKLEGLRAQRQADKVAAGKGKTGISEAPNVRPLSDWLSLNGAFKNGAEGDTAALMSRYIDVVVGDMSSAHWQANLRR